MCVNMSTTKTMEQAILIGRTGKYDQLTILNSGFQLYPQLPFKPARIMVQSMEIWWLIVTKREAKISVTVKVAFIYHQRWYAYLFTIIEYLSAFHTYKNHEISFPGTFRRKLMLRNVSYLLTMPFKTFNESGT